MEYVEIETMMIKLNWKNEVAGSGLDGTLRDMAQDRPL
jgi:hypothetical protein